MMKKYDAVIFIGRFQPFHNAHLEIVRRAYENTDNLIMVFGSRFKPVSFKNPFQDDNYISEVKGCIHQNFRKSLFIIEQEDLYEDTSWCKGVQEKVEKILTSEDKEIAIIGCNKDESSYYLKMFPQWSLIEVPYDENLSATQIRELYFVEHPNINFLKGVVPSGIYNYLESMIYSEWHNHVVNERNFIDLYKSQYSSLPYAPVFVTVDAVVFQSGHVLMVRRDAYPGKGLMALPGGFLDAYGDASLQDAMIRELREETGLKVPSPVLRGSIRNTHVFDSIQRSSRGRTITHAFNIVLPDGELPRVKGGSDADKAFWVPFSKLNSKQCFEDHYQIIQHFL